MAEKQAHHGPTKPPMPAGSRDAVDSSTVAKTITDKNIQPAMAEAPPGQLLPPPGQGPELARMTTPTPTSPPSSLPVRPQDAGTLPAPKMISDSVATASQPVADTAATAPVTATTEIKSADGIYAHRADYHSIQGVLERHYRGYYSVRYCDPSEEDQHGGKFRLVDDQRIGQFNEGDVIALQGEMIPNGPEEYNLNPRFKIHTLRLVRQK